MRQTTSEALSRAGRRADLVEKVPCPPLARPGLVVAPTRRSIARSMSRQPGGPKNQRLLAASSDSAFVHGRRRGVVDALEVEGAVDDGPAGAVLPHALNFRLGFIQVWRQPSGAPLIMRSACVGSASV
jgi:hypothetical protein